MNTALEMHEVCKTLEDEIAQMGYATPSVEIRINGLNSPFCVVVKYRQWKSARKELRVLHGDTIEQAIQMAAVYVGEMPSVEEKQAALKRLHASPNGEGTEHDLYFESCIRLTTLLSLELHGFVCRALSPNTWKITDAGVRALNEGQT